MALAFFNSCAKGDQIRDVYMDEADKLFLSGGYSGKLEVALWRPKMVGCEVSPDLFNFVKNSSVLPILPFNSKRQMIGVEPIRLLDMNYGMAAMRVGTSEQSAEYLTGVWADYQNTKSNVLVRQLFVKILELSSGIV
jgi:hypothetical protein